jgi:hypothetical protein
VIAEELGSRRGPTVLSGTRDVHVNVPNFRAGAEMAWQYTPAIAVAIASLASGRLPQPHVALLGHTDITDTFTLSKPSVTEPMHVLNLVAQGFRQVVVPRQSAVADAMVGLLEEAGIELCVEEDPLAIFSSMLPSIFGLPESAGLWGEQEAGTVCEQDMRQISLLWCGHLISMRACTTGRLCRGRWADGGARGAR